MSLGSPPPTRGTPIVKNSLFTLSRITPAYAGNTRGRKATTRFNRDHPRLRGEHYSNALHLLNRSGSPPPTRGTLINNKPYCLNLRITPAYAGNTYTSDSYFITIWDHPRLRGEHPYTIAMKYSEVGSPPPTRGTRSYPSNFYN